MFYEPKDGHGLPYNPFNALVTPRPIGWISTHDGQGHDILPRILFLMRLPMSHHRSCFLQRV